MTAKPESAPRWQRRPDARPEEILDAAETVFGEQGFARAKLEDVARQAGISKGTVYRYFESKEALFREMVRAKVVSRVAQGEGIARQWDGDAATLLTTLMRRMWATMREPGMSQLSRLVHSELANFPELARFYFDEVIVRSRAMLQGAVDRGIATGEFRPESRLVVARAIPTLLVHAAQTQCFFARFDPAALTDAQVVDGVIDLVLHGVLARPTDRHPQSPSTNNP